jgi:hypothetical protein
VTDNRLYEEYWAGQTPADPGRSFPEDYALAQARGRASVIEFCDRVSHLTCTRPAPPELQVVEEARKECEALREARAPVPEVQDSPVEQSKPDVEPPPTPDYSAPSGATQCTLDACTSPDAVALLSMHDVREVCVALVKEAGFSRGMQGDLSGKFERLAGAGDPDSVLRGLLLLRGSAGQADLEREWRGGGPKNITQTEAVSGACSKCFADNVRAGGLNERETVPQHGLRTNTLHHNL